MSVVVVKTMGLSEATANLILLMLTFVAVAMSFVWGWLVDRRGPKQTLVWVLVSWAVGLVIGGISIGFGSSGIVPFLIAGAILGSGLGGVQVADRVLMVRLSPPDKLGEFFGIYGLVGKGSQVVGQLLYGALIFLLLDSLGNGAYQVAVLSLLVTMVIGLWLIRPVRDDWAGSGEADIASRAPDTRRPADPSASRPRPPRSNRVRPGSRSGGAHARPRPSRPSPRVTVGPAPSRGRPGPAPPRRRARADRRSGANADRERDRVADGAARRPRSTSRTENPPPTPRLHAR